MIKTLQLVALYAGYNHSKVGDNQGVAVTEMTRSGRTYGDDGDFSLLTQVAQLPSSYKVPFH